MRFTRELPANVNLIRGHSDADVRVNDRVLTRSFLLSASNLIAEWRPDSVTALTVRDFDDLIAWQPEIILLGTGARQLFPARDIYAAILAKGIGFEVMDTGAACRTFN